MQNIGLVLEGGGMRGVYTAGVLEFFMEADIFFPYVIGVSAGACNAASYISRQQGRNQKVTIDYVNHPSYISFKNLFLKRQLFDMDLIFDDIPRRLVPFDFEKFHTAKERFIIGTTDCKTGTPLYFEKSNCSNDILTIIRASSSLPFVAKAVNYNGSLLMDGGISDPIPIKKAQQDGMLKNVVVLTQNYGYRKKRSSVSLVSKLLNKDFKGLGQAMNDRPYIYNETIEYIEQLENENKVFVIRPQEKLQVGRIEKDKVKLTDLYEQGYDDARRVYNEMMRWINKK